MSDVPPVYGASFILADPNGVPQLDEHWFVVQDYPHHKMKHGDRVVGYDGIRASQSSLAALKKHQQAKLKDPNAVMTYSFVKKDNLKDLTPLMSHKPTKSYGYCYKCQAIRVKLYWDTGDKPSLRIFRRHINRDLSHDFFGLEKTEVVCINSNLDHELQDHLSHAVKVANLLVDENRRVPGSRHIPFEAEFEDIKHVIKEYCNGEPWSGAKRMVHSMQYFVRPILIGSGSRDNDVGFEADLIKWVNEIEMNSRFEFFVGCFYVPNHKAYHLIYIRLEESSTLGALGRAMERLAEKKQSQE